MNAILAGIGGAGALFVGAAVALQVAGQLGPEKNQIGESVDGQPAPSEAPSQVDEPSAAEKKAILKWIAENIGDPEAKVIKWGPSSNWGRLIRVRYKTPYGGMDVVRLMFNFYSDGSGRVQVWTRPEEPSWGGTPNPMADALKRMAEGPDDSGNWRTPSATTQQGAERSAIP